MQVPATVLSLMGDSFPVDRGIEDAFARRCRLPVMRYADFVARYLDGTHTADIPRRVTALRQELARQQPAPVLVMGRSSGAIVAALMAAEAPVNLAGILALGYPFRHPDRADEPARYRHLAGLGVPMLLIQGRRDVYGLAGQIPALKLSPSVQYHEIDADHGFVLDDARWNRVIALFDRFADAALADWRNRLR